MRTSIEDFKGKLAAFDAQKQKLQENIAAAQEDIDRAAAAMDAAVADGDQDAFSAAKSRLGIAETKKEFAQRSLTALIENGAIPAEDIEAFINERVSRIRAIDRAGCSDLISKLHAISADVNRAEAEAMNIYREIELACTVLGLKLPNEINQVRVSGNATYMKRFMSVPVRIGNITAQSENRLFFLAGKGGHSPG